MKPFIYLFLFMALAACVNRPIGQFYSHLPYERWRKADTLELPVVVDSITCARAKAGTMWELWIDIRHTNAYSYSNLAMGLSSTQLDTTVNLPLTNERGAWVGHGVGYLYQSSHYVGTFHPDTAKADTLRFRLVSFMPDSILEGIHDIGIRLLTP